MPSGRRRNPAQPRRPDLFDASTIRSTSRAEDQVTQVSGAGRLALEKISRPAFQKGASR